VRDLCGDWKNCRTFRRFGWVSFLTAMLVAALTALSYAELGSRFPQSGGVAYFVHRAFHTDWLSILVGWLMFCTCLVSMATLSSICRLSHFCSSHSSLVDCSFSGLAFVNFRGMGSPQPSTFLHGLEVSGLLIVILVSTLFLIGGAGAGNPVSLGSSQQAMGWTGVFQGAARLRLHWI